MEMDEDHLERTQLSSSDKVRTYHKRLNIRDGVKTLSMCIEEPLKIFNQKE